MQVNPKGKKDGQNKVLRGWCFRSDVYLNLAHRGFRFPSSKNIYGFRIVIGIKNEKKY